MARAGLVVLGLIVAIPGAIFWIVLDIEARDLESCSFALEPDCPVDVEEALPLIQQWRAIAAAVTLVAATVLLVGALWPPSRPREVVAAAPREFNALRILEERYARGEIDEAEFQRRRDYLKKSDRDPPP